MPLSETNAPGLTATPDGCERFPGPAPTVLQHFDSPVPTGRVAAAEGKPPRAIEARVRDGRYQRLPRALEHVRVRITESSLHHIVIVGGGAAGLELATKLGHRLGRRKKAQVTLVDRNRTHIWKPHLHEVAAGTLEAGTRWIISPRLLITILATASGR